jgi:hypothetical protein
MIRNIALRILALLLAVPFGMIQVNPAINDNYLLVAWGVLAVTAVLLGQLLVMLFGAHATSRARRMTRIRSQRSEDLE